MKKTPVICTKRSLSRFRLAIGAICLAGAVPTLSQATEYYWDADGDTTTAIGGTGPWDNTSALWRMGSTTSPLTTFPVVGTANANADLLGTAGTLTLSTGIFVNNITVAPTNGTAYIITGSALTLGVGAQSDIDVATGTSLTITSTLASTDGFVKSSAGILALDSPAGTSNVVGAISVTGGTLQLGSTTAGDVAASQVLRSNAVTLAAGTTLTTTSQTGTGATTDLRIGQLSGSGAVTPGVVGTAGGAINELALGSATFSGAITTTGGLNLRGGNGTTQTFNGNLTGLTGTIGINSGATLALSGTGDATSGVLGPNTGTTTTIAVRGGTFMLDNSGGNTSATNGRVSSGTAVTTLGGLFSLIGNSAGTTQAVGVITGGSGAANVSVTNNSTTAPTTLTFGNGVTAGTAFSLRGSTSETINFIGASGTAGAGGTLGAGGNNPAITFIGTPFTGTNTGLLASSAGSDTTIGFGIVTTGGDTNYAGYSTTTGIIPLANTPRDQTNLASATTTERVGFAPTANTTLSAALSVGVLKITPGAAGLSLTANAALSSPAILFTGTNDFTINGTGNVLPATTGTTYIYTIDPNTTLNISNGLAGGSHPINKSGAGFLNLNGATNQLAFTSAVNINLDQGVLRGTTTTLGGGATTAAGAFTNLNFDGGTLEISGGGAFSRALTTSNATAAGGTIGWNVSGTNRGDGGFSAVGGEADVTIVTAIGGTTAATLQWNSGDFLQNGYALLFGSTKSDSLVNLTNNLQLDDTVTATNSYFAREIRVTAGVTGSSARLSGVISGTANSDLLKTGGGILELSNTNTYLGNTLVQGGTLLVTGSINSSPNVRVTSGALTLNNATALSDTGTLSLVATTTLNLNGPVNTSEIIGSLILDGTYEAAGVYTAANLTTLDSNINFASLNGETLTVGMTPVPEPNTVLGGLLLVGVAGWTQRRRLRGSVRA